jgi:hypothetical protein
VRGAGPRATKRYEETGAARAAPSRLTSRLTAHWRE